MNYCGQLGQGTELQFPRLRRHHSRWSTAEEATLRQLVALHDAQFVLAREQGFASWAKLKAYAEPSSHPRVHGLMRTRQSAGLSSVGADS